MQLGKRHRQDHLHTCGENFIIDPIHHDQTFVLIIPNFTPTKKVPTRTFFHTSNLSKHDYQYHDGRSNPADQVYLNKNKHCLVPELNCQLPKSP